jgi:hypothetical protein
MPEKRRCKKPIFILEVVIAIGVVAVFFAGVLRNSLMSFYKERWALVELGFQWEVDLKKMEILSREWPKVDWSNAKCSKGGAVILEVTFNNKKYFKEWSYSVDYKRSKNWVILTEEYFGSEPRKNFFYRPSD